MTLEQKSQAINTWLRYHSDYQVTLSFLSLYGCLEIKILHKQKILHMWIGDTLEKRLDEVIFFLRIEEPGDEQKTQQ